MATAHGSSAALPNALTEGFQAAFLGGAVIAVLGLVLTLVLIRSRDSRAHVELGSAPASEPPAKDAARESAPPSERLANEAA
jgi:hypothetical protein